MPAVSILSEHAISQNQSSGLSCLAVTFVTTCPQEVLANKSKDLQNARRHCPTTSVCLGQRRYSKTCCRVPYVALNQGASPFPFKYKRKYFCCFLYFFPLQFPEAVLRVRINVLPICERTVFCILRPYVWITFRQQH